MRVCVVGLGYIGLPTALMLAANGNKVTGVDYNSGLVKTLQNGELTFEEIGLEELFQEALNKDITFTTEYVCCDIYIIATPTPYDKNTKKIQPDYVVAAVNKVLEVCPDNAIIIIESTISPGTIDRAIRPLFSNNAKKLGENIHIAHAPERIIPGKMVYELKSNSRTIGADKKEIGEKVKKLYSSFCKGEIVVTDIRTAEMTKVVENTFRDINIAFANELLKICRHDGMNVYEIIRIANMHPRVNILQPGPGVGGHCISVDPWFLVGDYPGLTSLTKHARLINDSMPQFVLNRIYNIMRENKISDPSKVGLYGMTYKEDVDDIRESPTLQLLENMHQHLGSGIKLYDPLINESMVDNQFTDFDRFLEKVDMVVIMVAHSHIKKNMDRLADKIVLDTRNICSFPKRYTL